MYNVCVIYKDKDCFSNLNVLLGEYEQVHNVKFEVQGYRSSDEYFLKNDTESDFIFIEIDMPTLNGMEIAKKIREYRPEVVIAFICNNAQYALSCYEYGVVGYLLKPLQKDATFACLKRGIFILRRTMRRKVSIKTTEGIVVVPIGEILYVEVQRHYIYYHLHPKSKQWQKTLKVRGSIKEADNILQNFDFAHCSSSTIINLVHVYSLVNASIYLPGVIVDLRRTYKAEFTDRYMKFLTEREVKRL